MTPTLHTLSAEAEHMWQCAHWKEFCTSERALLARVAAYLLPPGAASLRLTSSLSLFRSSFESGVRRSHSLWSHSMEDWRGSSVEDWRGSSVCRIERHGGLVMLWYGMFVQ